MIDRIIGERELFISDCSVEDTAFVLSREDIPFSRLEKEGEGIRLRLPVYRCALVTAKLRAAGASVAVGAPTGLFGLFFLYRKRVGLLIGALLFFSLIFLSGKVIWVVNVKGNDRVSDERIIATLESLGCGVGDFYEQIDFDTLHNRFLMECEGIGWIAVNMNGTHANVEVREVIDEKKTTGDKAGFYNIVASESGRIEGLANSGGKPVVEIGDTVLEGELLVSGAISYANDTKNRFESAEGQIFASVNRSFEVTVPHKEIKKKYTGKVLEKKTIRIFNFDINLFRNSRIYGGLYDKITVTKQIYLMDSIPLPVYVSIARFKEFETVEAVYTEREARELCKKKYSEKLVSVLGDAQILSKSVSESLDEGGCTISCSLYCVADIAKKVPVLLSEEKENTEETDR